MSETTEQIASPELCEWLGKWSDFSENEWRLTFEMRNSFVSESVDAGIFHRVLFACAMATEGLGTIGFSINGILTSLAVNFYADNDGLTLLIDRQELLKGVIEFAEMVAKRMASTTPKNQDDQK